MNKITDFYIGTEVIFNGVLGAVDKLNQKDKHVRVTFEDKVTYYPIVNSLSGDSQRTWYFGGTYARTLEDLIITKPIDKTITKENLLDILKWSGFKFEHIGGDCGDYHSNDSYAWVLGKVKIATSNYTIQTYRNNDVLTADNEILRFDIDDIHYTYHSDDDEVITKNFDLFVSFIKSNFDLNYTGFPLLLYAYDSAISALNLKDAGNNMTSMIIGKRLIIFENSQETLDTINNFGKLLWMDKNKQNGLPENMCGKYETTRNG